MKPYYQDDAVTIYHGDCREILPQLGPVDLVLTDPPYGINKADWDAEFPLWWINAASEIAPLLGVMPGTWNLLKLPQQAGRARYKWTLAAHLVNGMTRGAMGFGNWIPCVVYERSVDPIDFCTEFSAWCESAGISASDLDNICRTSDMGAWWVSRLKHRAAIPSRTNWEKIKAAVRPPARLEDFIKCADYSPSGDCRSFNVGADIKPDHPSPKPLNVIKWFVECLPARTILDPFMGSGTTLRAAKDLGRKAIGIEIEEKYCEVAARRMAQEVLPLAL